MRSRIFVAFASLGEIIFGIILSLVQSRPALPDPLQASVPAPPIEPSRWEADFVLSQFNQSYSLTADMDHCTVQLDGSTPDSVEMKQEIDAPLGDSATLLVYAGWPRSDTGTVTGITNRSNDTPRNCIYENKLGPTVVWLVWGCKQLCIHSMIEHYVVAVEHDGIASYVVRIEEPFLDETLTGGHCLRPQFQCKLDDATGGCAGVIDQPGSTFSTIGDGYTSVTGERSVISENDQISIDFQHRAFIECDSRILATTEWGYQLDAELGRPAYLITPQVDEFKFDFIVPNDPNPLKRAAFSAALAELEELHRKNHCK